MNEHLPNPLIFIEKNKVKGYDVDKNQRMHIPAMIQMLHEAAMQHVLHLKVSAKELAAHNLGWILHQQYLEIFEQPKLGEVVEVKTHPSGKEKVFTYRDFQMRNEDGKILAQASSTWLLMNTAARSMGVYPDFISEMLEPSNEIPHLPRAPRLRVKLQNPKWQKTYQIGFHDLDFNGHLSNFYYFKWMIDTMSSDFLQNNTLTSFRLKFKEECHLDEVVEVNVQEEGEGAFLHVILRDGKVLAEGRTVWV